MSPIRKTQIRVPSIRRELRRKRSFSYEVVGKFLLGFLARFVIAAVGVGLAQYWIQPDQQQLTTLDLVKIGLVSLGLVFADYIKDIVQETASVAIEKQDDILFGLISGGIEETVEDIIKNQQNNPTEYFRILLIRIESATKIIFGLSEAQGVKVSANLMVVSSDSSGSTKLELKYWGTRLAGREPITLDVDPKNPAPGAVQAYINKKPVYIPNILDPTVKKHFGEDKDYRTIHSTPVLLPGGRVCAIVNIDSDKVDFFEDPVLRETLRVKTKPLLSLIALEHKSL